MSNLPPGPATAPTTRSVGVSISACPPRTAELLLRNGRPEVHRDGCGGPCRRASPSGEEGTTSAGEGRVAGEQRTTPSSPCAIQLIASRGVSLSAFSCALGHLHLVTQRMVAQRSARVLRRLRQVVLICGTVARQFVGRSRTTATGCHRSRRGNRRRSGPSQSAAGVNRTTSAQNPARNISFFSDTSHGDVS